MCHVKYHGYPNLRIIGNDRMSTTRFWYPDNSAPVRIIFLIPRARHFLRRDPHLRRRKKLPFLIFTTRPIFRRYQQIRLPQKTPESAKYRTPQPPLYLRRLMHIRKNRQPVFFLILPEFQPFFNPGPRYTQPNCDCLIIRSLENIWHISSPATAPNFRHHQRVPLALNHTRPQKRGRHFFIENQFFPTKCALQPAWDS